MMLNVLNTFQRVCCATFTLICVMGLGPNATCQFNREPAKNKIGMATTTPANIKKIAASEALFLTTATPNYVKKKTPGLFGEKLANADLARAESKNSVEKWGRFTIVDDASRADLVLVMLEWNETSRWGNNLQCHARLAVYEGGTTAPEDATPLWEIEDGKWGGCSAAATVVKDLKKDVERAARID